ncbi:MAG: hypothetical protein COU28_00275 [Candidatus Magasanikbacteria bacterium CG10_big_fil_rev_8_21_14_0_10_36_16]|uniref:Uncharacterized protein n=1 Tax=Candidatus Magasanikbacteria bacterium CG10_big_fil_rev_8_21_14_0_10_36_16 TaxID=1974645 RepID=A0A2H0TZJ8_9BACT|nr:MAG: hypothetical protein COU28_00275 [Candidatus Magasanikbacteria bacterium CG10_big_fil_rev_8_21_14_0_10_36_16]
MEEDNLPNQPTDNSNLENATPEITPPIRLSFFKKHLWKIILGVLALIIVSFITLYFWPFGNTTQNTKTTNNWSIDNINFQNDIIQNSTVTELPTNNTNQAIIANNIISYLDNLSYTDNNEEGINLVTYDINIDNTLRQNTFTNEAKYRDEAYNISEHEYLWNFASQIFASINEKNYIEKFIINTDGKEGNLASMYLNDNNEWELVIDPVDILKNGQMFDSQDFIYTLVHEFGHLLALNKTQVDYNNYDENTCNTHLLSEGCLYQNSYSYQYYLKFWDGKLFDEWYNNVDGGSEDAVQYFYDEYPNNFVTEYAATDPDEDIAESFANFVLREKPTFDTLIKDQKEDFFYTYTNLLNIRQKIRDNITKLDPNFFSKPLIIK